MKVKDQGVTSGGLADAISTMVQQVTTAMTRARGMEGIFSVTVLRDGGGTQE